MKLVKKPTRQASLQHTTLKKIKLMMKDAKRGEFVSKIPRIVIKGVNDTTIGRIEQTQRGHLNLSRSTSRAVSTPRHNNRSSLLLFVEAKIDGESSANSSLESFLSHEDECNIADESEPSKLNVIDTSQENLAGRDSLPSVSRYSNDFRDPAMSSTFAAIRNAAETTVEQPPNGPDDLTDEVDENKERTRDEFNDTLEYVDFIMAAAEQKGLGKFTELTATRKKALDSKFKVA